MATLTYSRVSEDAHDGHTKVLTHLSTMAEQGWELVSAQADHFEGTGWVHTFYWKRA